jgi:hypothetical protein
MKRAGQGVLWRWQHLVVRAVAGEQLCCTVVGELQASLLRIPAHCAASSCDSSHLLLVLLQQAM